MGEEYLPKFGLFLSLGGYYLIEKNIDWLNLWGGGGDKGGSAIVLTFRKYLF